MWQNILGGSLYLAFIAAAFYYSRKRRAAIRQELDGPLDEWSNPSYKKKALAFGIPGAILLNICILLLVWYLVQGVVPGTDATQESIPIVALLVSGIVLGVAGLVTAVVYSVKGGPKEGYVSMRGGPIPVAQSKKGTPFFIAGAIAAALVFPTQYLVPPMLVPFLIAIPIILFAMGGLVVRGVIDLESKERHGPSKGARIMVLAVLATFMVAGMMYAPLSRLDFEAQGSRSSTTSFEWRELESGRFDESFPMTGIPQSATWMSPEMALQGSQLNLTFAYNLPLLETNPVMTVKVEFLNETWQTVHDGEIRGWENLQRNGTHWRVSVTYNAQFDRDFQLGYTYAQAYRLHCVVEDGRERCEEWVGH